MHDKMQKVKKRSETKKMVLTQKKRFFLKEQKKNRH